MYKILKHNKRFNSKTFTTYDEARNYVRKWLRKKQGVQGHPPLKEHGFSIQPI